jgi:hypothetical protein
MRTDVFCLSRGGKDPLLRFYRSALADRCRSSPKRLLRGRRIVETFRYQWLDAKDFKTKQLRVVAMTLAPSKLDFTFTSSLLSTSLPFP